MKKKLTGLKLFPATASLEDIAMDLLGPFIKTPRGNDHLLVVVDRFSKLARTVPLKNTRDIDIARAFTSQWAFTYGIPKSVLSDNGPQFTARLMLETHRILGIRELFTTTYHPQTNGQTERMNRTICEGLRKFVAEHPKDWDLHTDAITYATIRNAMSPQGCHH